VIVIDPHATRGWRARRLDDVLPPAERSRAMLWPELLAAGRAVRDRGDTPAVPRAPGDVFARLCTLRVADAPRVVDLTHGQCVDEQLMVASLASAFGLSQLLAAAQAGMSTAFADPSRPPEAQLSEVHPTLFAATPAYFERLREESLGRVRAARPLRRAAIDRSLAVGQRVAALARAGEAPGRVLAAEHALARRVALDALAGVFGARLRFAVTVGAPLPVGVAEWFHACGVLVLEGYGLTEAAGLTHLNTPAAWRFGTAGRSLPGVTSTLVDGELTLDGPMIRGTLRTGDRASIDRDGFLVVRGRISA
jgi:long-chain acyl-CoA synthetase